MVPRQKHNITSHPPCRDSELYSRRRVTCDEGQIRLDAVPQSIQQNQPKSGTTTGGPICLSSVSPAQTYVSWRPDPGAMALDAFTLDWTKVRGYANPPWNLISRVLTTARNQRARVTLIAPSWTAQAWYPVLLEMLVQEPLLLPLIPTLIIPTHRVNKPDIVPQLAVWVISGIDSEAKTFQRRLHNSSWPPDGLKHQSHMTLYLENGYAGAIRGIQIPFLEI